MSQNLNKVLLIGRLIEKPTLDDSGVPLTWLLVGTTHRYVDGDEQRTEAHRVLVRGLQAEQCVQHLDKGRLVYVEGTLSGGEVLARHVHFLGLQAAQAAAQEPPK